jgi:hypothetical protein
MTGSATKQSRKTGSYWIASLALAMTTVLTFRRSEPVAPPDFARRANVSLAL